MDHKEDIVDELCPFCFEEVELKAEKKIQNCPKCGKPIRPCSLCDMDKVVCSQCYLDMNE